MVVMGVFRTVCIVWYSLSECACVCERSKILTSLAPLWEMGLHMTFIYSFILLCIFRIFLLLSIYYFYHQKKNKGIFPRRKAHRAPAKCKDSAENSGWRTGPRPSEADSVTEWRRRRCNLYKCRPGSLLSWVCPDCHGVTNKGYSWTLTDL